MLLCTHTCKHSYYTAMSASAAKVFAHLSIHIFCHSITLHTILENVWRGKEANWLQLISCIYNWDILYETIYW